MVLGFIISKEDSLPKYSPCDISMADDCGKWFRPTHLSNSTEEKDFEIKRGDPLFYIKFHTKDKVQLKRFNMNDEILSHVASTVQVKKYLASTKLNKLYKLYKESKLKPLLRRSSDRLFLFN